MLVLRRLDIEGFGLYAESSAVEIPEKGVTVIYGDNGRGKTTLMKAFRLALLGTPFGGQSTAPHESVKKPWILDYCNRDQGATGKYNFEIRLGVRYGSDEWEIARSASRRDPARRPQSDNDFDLSQSMRRRDGYVPGPDERKYLLQAMLPEEISRFFLFDGELLNQYAELLDNNSEMGRRISESIEQILGVPVLKRSRDHLAALSQKLSREAATEASRNQETQLLGNSLNAKHEERQAQRRELDRAVKERDELQVELQELESEMRKQEIYTAAVQRLEQARAARDEAQEVQSTKFSDLKREMKDAWRTILIERVAEARADSQSAIVDAVDQLTHRLRYRAVERRHCDVCGQDLSADHAHAVSQTLPEGGASPYSSGAAQDAITRATRLDRFKQIDVRRTVGAIWNDIGQARINEVEAAGKIVDEEETLGGRSHEKQLRSLQDNYGRVLVKLESMHNAIQKTEDNLEEIDNYIDHLEMNISQKGAVALTEKQTRKNVASSAKEVFTAAVNRYKRALRANVEETATGLFLRMTTGKADYERLSINDHYGLSIVHKDGQTESGRSAGQEQVVALALIGALQANAPLRGPIVMDTPFGRLDPHHTRNVVTTLPSMADQVVLLVQEGEIDRSTVRSHLGRHLVKEYELSGSSFRQTKIVEVH